MGTEGLGNCGFEKETSLKAVTLKGRDVLKNNADQVFVWHVLSITPGFNF